MPENHDDKYITFKRDDLISVTDGYTTFKSDTEIQDAVVIRRQDFFAAPALAGYAASIALAVKLTDEDDRRNALMGVADYFERQAQLAADEGFKFPDV